MSVLVKFNDGYGHYEFEGVFPNGTTKSEIVTTVQKAIIREARSRGLELDDLGFFLSDVKEMVDIYRLRDGRMYQPDNFGHLT